MRRALAKMSGSRPLLFAFDLDATLWVRLRLALCWRGWLTARSPFAVVCAQDNEMFLMNGPPFKQHKKMPHAVVDRGGDVNRLTSGSLLALRHLTSPEWHGSVQLAAVSRTSYPEWAQECLELMQFEHGTTNELVSVKSVLHFVHAYPGDKQTHFRRIQKESGVDFDQMVFFDNERRNVTSVARLGVHSVFTPDAMTEVAWQKTLAKFGIDIDADEDDDGSNSNSSK